ncbi:MAG: hypothetical protein P8Z75_05325 [Gammaproteobacteria bacterium]|jgi:hypothetical protein
MLRKCFVLVILLLPLSAYAKQGTNYSKLLLGSWKVEGIKAKGSTEFRPPKHAIRWTFTRNGTLIERLGKSGAKITWHYVVVGKEIKVRIEHMAFTWKILGADDKVMLIQHQLGLYKIRHL